MSRLKLAARVYATILVALFGLACLNGGLWLLNQASSFAVVAGVSVLCFTTFLVLLILTHLWKGTKTDA